MPNRRQATERQMAGADSHAAQCAVMLLNSAWRDALGRQDNYQMDVML